MDTSILKCYYCTCEFDKYNNSLQHLQQSHWDLQIKIKQFQLCPSTGRLELQTKSYPIIPSHLVDNEVVQYDPSTGNIHKIKEAHPVITPSSPDIKRRAQCPEAKHSKTQSVEKDLSNVTLEKTKIRMCHT